MRSTHGQGVDVILNSLTREFVDASLRLLPRGGRFLEMGKIDVRDASAVAAEYAHVAYQVFNLMDVEPHRIQQMLAELVPLFERGVFIPPPITSWDIRRAPQAFRELAQARHIGKFVLTFARGLNPKGTVLITGGTGTLGALVARHLVQRHGVKRLLLISLRGPDAAGADALRNELEQAGAQVTLAACDAADRTALQHLLDGIPANHPLTAVVHTAGKLDDGVLGALTPERLRSVLAPKVDAAWHLHELTKGLDLAAFVLFSSIYGVLGNPGQSNYAAANAFLDALAHHRKACGLTALSLNWGYWEQQSGMTAHLRETDLRRMRRGGLRAFSSGEALALFDAALVRDYATLIPARLDLPGLGNYMQDVHPLLRGLVRRRAPKANADNSVAGGLNQRLPTLPAEDRERVLLDLVRAEIAPVLGIPSAATLDPRRPLRELGLDSLMAVEIRNRLSAATGLRLPATLLFDYPTPLALAGFIDSKINKPPQDGSPSRPMNDAEIQHLLASVPVHRLKEAGLIDTLLRLAVPTNGATDRSPTTANQIDALATMSAEEMIKMALNNRNKKPETNL